MKTDTRPELGTLPPRIARLPVDHRGYPVPWFVGWVDGPDGPETVPDHRCVDGRKWSRAVKEKLCWICGERLGGWLAFPIGPMCAITRTTSEPPSHRDCAEWSIRMCPFLSNPAAIRRDDHLPGDVEAPGGAGLSRNPGVTCLWIARSFEIWRDPLGKPLITVGDPSAVTWWREGRPASRAECEASIESGLPALLVPAQRQGDFAVRALGRQYERARAFFPAVVLEDVG